MPQPGYHQLSSRPKNQIVTADTPLTAVEQQFVDNYIQCSNLTEAVQRLEEYKNKSRQCCSQIGSTFIKRPNVKAAIDAVLEQMKDDTIANAKEVMAYFTSVMRGEVKDQFGLEAPLSERTKAAQELAKRTIDIQNRQAGTADQSIEIKLDWSRDNEQNEEG